MPDGDDLLAVLERETARQDHLTKLFGLVILAVMVVLSAKVIDLI
jgi:hypothetical protein